MTHQKQQNYLVSSYLAVDVIIIMKFGKGVDVYEVVAWEKFDVYNLSGVNFTRG